MAIRTIFSMAQECAAGERTGWYDFVRDYGRIARNLLLHYFPALGPVVQEHVCGVFARAREANNAWFKGLRFQNEREFVMAFRDLLLAYGRAVARIPAADVSHEQLRQTLDGLNLVERQMLWLLAKGYTAEQIAPIMMNAEATARELERVAEERLARLLSGSTAQALMEAAERSKSETCPPLKTFNNIVNGQISWRERDVAEEHIRTCFYCIERFTAFQESLRLRKDCGPLPDAEVEPLLNSLGLPPVKGKGLLAKLLARC